MLVCRWSDRNDPVRKEKDNSRDSGSNCKAKT